MADTKSLVYYSGRISQILDTDNLIVGSGIKSPGAYDLTITPGGSNVTIGANKNLTAAAGTGAVDFSAASGVFKTTTGAVTIGPGTVTVSGVTTFTAAGTALTVNNNALVSGWLYADGGVDRSGAGTLVIGGANSTTVNVGTHANTTTVAVGGAGTTTMNLGTGAAMTALNIGTGMGATDNIAIGGAGSMTTIGGDLTVNGNEYILGSSDFTGTVTFKGNVNVGDGVGTDLLTFSSSAFTVGDILPNVTQTDDLGSASKEWAEIYAVNLTLSGALILEDLTVNGDTILGSAADDDLTINASVLGDVGFLAANDHTIAVYPSTGNSNGGSMTYRSGDGAGTGTGGTTTLEAGTGGGTDGTGGDIEVLGGAGGATNGDGGDVLIAAGSSPGTGVGGNVTIRGGAGDTIGQIFIGDANTSLVTLGTGGTTTPVSFGGYVSSDIHPSIDNTYDLGESGRVWANVWATTLHGAWTPPGHFLPAADNTYNLGALATRWAKLYLGPTSLNVYQDPNTTGSATENKKLTVGYTGTTHGQILFTETAGGDKLYIQASTPTDTDVDGNHIDIIPGSGDGSGAGGTVQVLAGAGGTSGDGGNIVLTAGASGGSGSAGGDVSATGGNGTVNGGTVYLTAGTGGTTNGYVNVRVGANLLFQAAFAAGAGTLTVQGSTTLGTTGTGNIDLPNNASARFKIEGSSVSANVTAANLNTLTAGPASDASALHYHPTSGAANYIAFTAKNGETMNQYRLVALDHTTGTPYIFLADASGGNGDTGSADVVGLNLTDASGGTNIDCSVQVNGETVALPDAAWVGSTPPTTSQVGSRVYLGATGLMTLTPPSGSGDNVIRVGWVSKGGSGASKIVIDIGEGVVLD